MANITTSKAAGQGGRVLIIGLGALGCPAAAILARAGLTRLTLVDDDHVELSNLQRQVLFTDTDVGLPKVECAAREIARRGDAVGLRPVATRFDRGNANKLFDGHDIVLDCCDNAETKSLINATAVTKRVPYLYAGVARSYGQLMAIDPGASACLTCAFGIHGQDRPDDGCSELGILAPIAGMIGSLQALKAIQYLSGRCGFNPGEMTTYELKQRRWRRVRFERISQCETCSGSAVQDTARRVESCHL